MARSTVLQKSNNWDSPAEVLRKEHRITSLQHRERKKRPYRKHSSQFWESQKQTDCQKTKKARISSQIPVDSASITSTTASSCLPNGKKSSKNSKRKNSKSKGRKK